MAGVAGVLIPLARNQALKGLETLIQHKAAGMAPWAKHWEPLTGRDSKPK